MKSRRSFPEDRNINSPANRSAGVRQPHRPDLSAFGRSAEAADDPASHRLLQRLQENEAEKARLLEEVAALKRLRDDQDDTIRDLTRALVSTKLLHGLLPICASCKKIRDDTGSWNVLESYICEHSEAAFTHGLCPECQHQLYPQLFGNREAVRPLTGE
jgi:hypothetical protein